MGTAQQPAEAPSLGDSDQCDHITLCLYCKMLLLLLLLFLV